jgi:TRAP-type C4-dicarboxylate transport system permease small subunit
MIEIGKNLADVLVCLIVIIFIFLIAFGMYKLMMKRINQEDKNDNI